MTVLQALAVTGMAVEGVVAVALMAVAVVVAAAVAVMVLGEWGDSEGVAVGMEATVGAAVVAETGRVVMGTEVGTGAKEVVEGSEAVAAVVREAEVAAAAAATVVGAKVATGPRKRYVHPSSHQQTPVRQTPEPHYHVESARAAVSADCHLPLQRRAQHFVS